MERRSQDVDEGVLLLLSGEGGRRWDPRSRDRRPGPATSNWTLDSGLAEPCKWIDPATYAPGEASYPAEAWFSCPYSYKKSGTCETVYEQSPYDSIPTSFWWCLVTMTTVGYGDVVPTQPLGKILAAIVMIFGIVVIALPITVIGSNH